MRKSIIGCLFMLVALCEATAQYHVSVLSTTKETVTMRCVGFGKKAPLASEDAELSALKTLLFVGASNTQHSRPLVQKDQSTVEAEFSQVFKTLYDTDYKQFVESSVIVVPFGKNDLKQKCITLDICLRVKPLKAYLENKGVIRRFGL